MTTIDKFDKLRLLSNNSQPLTSINIVGFIKLAPQQIHKILTRLSFWYVFC